MARKIKVYMKTFQNWRLDIVI